jgi:hypothetical protein
MTKLVCSAFAVMAIVAACSSTPKSGGSAPGTGSAVANPPATAACKADADCAVVETKCCDHCNGGKAEAFPVAEADAHKATGCEGTACTEMACGRATAVCEAGACAVKIQSL